MQACLVIELLSSAAGGNAQIPTTYARWSHNLMCVMQTRFSHNKKSAADRQLIFLVAEEGLDTCDLRVIALRRFAVTKNC